MWERACPRSKHRAEWHGLRPCSRVNPLPQELRRSSDFQQDSCSYMDRDNLGGPGRGRSGLASRKGCAAAPAISSQTRLRQPHQSRSAPAQRGVLLILIYQRPQEAERRHCEGRCRPWMAGKRCGPGWPVQRGPPGSKAGVREPRSAAQGPYVGAGGFAYFCRGRSKTKVSRRKGGRGQYRSHTKWLSPPNTPNRPSQTNPKPNAVIQANPRSDYQASTHTLYRR